MQISTIGPLALEEPLGGAADSNVMRGVHIKQQRTVAVKLLPPGVASRAIGRSTFSEDVKRLVQLEHPGIVRILGGAVQKGQPYLAMELVDGESLCQHLDRRGRLPWDAAVEMAEVICDALRYAHQRSVVHQRLTPTRVLLPAAGGVKIVGFDCILADRDDVLGLRSPMQVAHYLAPEVFRGKQSAGQAQSDLFSLGVLLYEALTGELPWPAESPADLIRVRRAAIAPHVSAMVLDCPVWLDLLVRRLLAVKRSDRLESADQTYRALVDARQKDAAGVGAAKQAWSGKRGILTVDTDRSEVRKLRRRGPSKVRDDSPFYERAWFLAAMLVALVGAGVWAMLPPGEDALFARARPLMESDDPGDWRRAEDRYLRPLRERFPDTQYDDSIREFDLRFAMHRAKTRSHTSRRLKRRAQSEAERRFSEAIQIEQFGDRLTAWQHYEAIFRIFLESDDLMDRAYAHLAERQIEQIRKGGGSQQDRDTFVNDKLAEAHSLFESGSLLEARRILRDIVALYGRNHEMKPVVDQARAAIRRIDGDGAIDSDGADKAQDPDKDQF